MIVAVQAYSKVEHLSWFGSFRALIAPRASSSRCGFRYSQTFSRAFFDARLFLSSGVVANHKIIEVPVAMSAVNSDGRNTSTCDTRRKRCC